MAVADESITRMNLSAIKKIDPYAKEIVDSSSHVAFYTFNSEQNEWEKTDVEGAFFIYHRNAEPFHSIFINNRLNTTSFVEPITGCLELQSQPPFLLYRNERSRIRGFWFYNSEECDRISSLVNGLLQNKERSPKQMQTRSGIALHINPKPQSTSIFNMLTKAQQDYNKQANFLNQSSSYLNLENDTPCNVLKFFESAKQATTDTLFNRVQPLSVDQLEKQQRAATPNDGLSLPTKDVDLGGASESRSSPFQMSSASRCTNPTKPIPLLSDYTKTSMSVLMSDGTEKCLRRLLVGEQPSPPTDARPALLPPTMFDAPNRKSDLGNSQPLNSVEFVQAFTYLIQNDEEFVNKLHKAYLKSYSNALIDTSRTYQ